MCAILSAQPAEDRTRLAIASRHRLRSGTNSPSVFVSLLIEGFLSALFVLQAAYLRSTKVELLQTDELFLYSLTRMVRDTCKETAYIVHNSGVNTVHDGLSVTVVCTMGRAASMMGRMCGKSLSEEDIEMFRYTLRGFGARWNIACELWSFLPCKALTLAQILS